MTSTLSTLTVNIAIHPLVSQHLATIREKSTPSEIFRGAIGRITQHLVTDATRSLPLVKETIETPVAKTVVDVLDTKTKLLLCPILRAGLVMADTALHMLPMASVYHIGLKRDEETHQAIAYYQNLPDHVQSDKTLVYLLDPMLATGGSALSAIQMLKEIGVKESNIALLCIIASPEGVLFLNENAPDVKIYTGSVDEKLNDKAYILPGLGDAGDRSFGTL